MPDIDELLNEKKKKSTYSEAAVNENVVNKVVSRMQRKIENEDEQFRKEEKAVEIKKLVEEGPAVSMKKATPADLMHSTDKGHRQLALIYNLIKFPFGIFTKFFNTFLGERLQSNLEASEMNMNAYQYLSLTVAAMFLTVLLAMTIVVPLYVFLDLNPWMAFLFILLFPIFVFAYMLIVPANRAAKISFDIDRQLPFALRHMAIEVKAGVTLFRTMKSIANADYGIVSDGFTKVLSDIDKGMTTEAALEQWSRKTRSDGLRRALSHIVRALRTGGNLSQIMITIAEDINFERKTRISEYASKLNLLSLFLMMTVIVLPVMLTVLTAIGSSAIVRQFAGLFSVFSPTLLIIIYFVLTPLFLFIFMTIVKASDPGY